MNHFDGAEHFSAAIAATLGIAYYDYSVGPFISLWAAYLAPIVIVGFACNRVATISLAVLGSIAFLVVDQVVGHPYPTSFDFAIATVSRMLALIVVAVLVSEVRRLRLKVMDLEAKRGDVSAKIDVHEDVTIRCSFPKSSVRE